MEKPAFLLFLLIIASLALSCAGEVTRGPGAAGDDSVVLAPGADGGLVVSNSDGGGGGGAEICDNGLDDDADGQVDEECACDPAASTVQACYPGAAATRKVGACKDGTQPCQTNGIEFATWGPCAGAVLPVTEICHDKIDNDCDGEVDEGCIVTVNVNIDGDCVWAACPASAPHPVGCKITMAGSDCRGCIANAQGSSKVYFQEGNQCGAGKVTGQLFCSSVPASGLDAGNCSINKTIKYYEKDASKCPAFGSGDGCS